MLLPIVIDDCQLPLLVRDKLYADFRNDFDDGMKKLLAVISPYYRTQSSGRVSSDDQYYIDYNCIAEMVDERIVCEIDVVSFDLEEPYSILTQFRFEGTDVASLESLELESVSETIDLILKTCVDKFSEKPARTVVSPGKKNVANFTLYNDKGSVLFHAHSTVKIVGNMRKGAVLFNIGALFSQIESTRHS
jgi:hypothetical protein